MSSGKIRNLFISHIHEDDEHVKNFKDLLQKREYMIRDSSITKDNPNQANNEEYIKRKILSPAIRWAGAIIVLVSPETKNSQWVKWEIEHARRWDKKIIGVWEHGAKDSDLPEVLDKYADHLVGWNSQKISDALNSVSSSWVNSDGTARKPRDISRYNC